TGAVADPARRGRGYPALAAAGARLPDHARAARHPHLELLPSHWAPPLDDARGGREPPVPPAPPLRPAVGGARVRSRRAADDPAWRAGGGRLARPADPLLLLPRARHARRSRPAADVAPVSLARGAGMGARARPRPRARRLPEHGAGDAAHRRRRPRLAE